MFYHTASTLIAGDQSKNIHNRDVLQSLISWINSKGGGTLYIPPGDYYIRCDYPKFIELRDNVHIVLDPAANLFVDNNEYTDPIKPSTEKWVVFRLNGVKNVSVKGGKITGDRKTILKDDHYGIGILIVQTSEKENDSKYIPKNITIEDIEIVDCYFDGISINAPITENIKIINCRCINNKRHGLSCTGGTDIQIIGGNYSHSNGTSPETGIDFENETSVSISNFSIRDVEIRENSGVGLYIHPGSIAGNSGETLYDFDVSGCSIEENGEAGLRIVGNETYDIHRFKVLNNTIQKNKEQGLILKYANDFIVSDNEISENGSEADKGHQGIQAQYIKYFNINNNIIYKNRDNGIIVYFNQNSYLGCISGNILQENENDAIDVRSPATVVDGNVVTSNHGHGISIKSTAQNCCVSNNVVIGNNQGVVGGKSGIFIGSNFCNVIGNLIRKSLGNSAPEQEYGIFNEGQENSFYGNDIRLSGSYANFHTKVLHPTWAANNPGIPCDKVEETKVDPNAPTKKLIKWISPRKQFFKIEDRNSSFTYIIVLEVDGFVEGDAIEVNIHNVATMNPTVKIYNNEYDPHHPKVNLLRSVQTNLEEIYAGRFIFNGKEWKVGLWVKND